MILAMPAMMAMHAPSTLAPRAAVAASTLPWLRRLLVMMVILAPHQMYANMVLAKALQHPVRVTTLAPSPIVTAQQAAV